MQSVSYVEGHDNYTFHDKLRLSMIFADEKEIIQVDKLGAVLVFLSQGLPFIQAGQEFLRSKFDGHSYNHNSYNSPDSINSLKWNNVTKYKELVEYYSGLIKIRKKFYEFRMKTAEEICNKITFNDIKYGAFIMNIDDFSLIINPLAEDIHIDTQKVEVYIDDKKASENHMYTLDNHITVLPKSAMLVKRI